MHLEVTLAFAAQGYHILCEKPMATSLEDCVKIEAAVKKAGIIFGMGHGASTSKHAGGTAKFRALISPLRSQS